MTKTHKKQNEHIKHSRLSNRIDFREEHDRLILSNKDWELILSLLKNPLKPNAALLSGIQSHNKLISE